MVFPWFYDIQIGFFANYKDYSTRATNELEEIINVALSVLYTLSEEPFTISISPSGRDGSWRFFCLRLALSAVLFFFFYEEEIR